MDEWISIPCERHASLKVSNPTTIGYSVCLPVEPETRTNQQTSAIVVGDAGNVAVLVVEFVSTKYPSFAVTLKFAVLIACHEAPPDTVATVVSASWDSLNKAYYNTTGSVNSLTSYPIRTISSSVVYPSVVRALIFAENNDDDPWVINQDLKF